MPSAIDRALFPHEAALRLAARRQELLAANVANADTPHYKARDLDFAAEMRRVLAGRQDGRAFARTHPRHLEGLAADPFGAVPKYRIDVQGNIDGNTVNMDRERAAMLENALRYEAALKVMNQELQHLKSAVKTQ